ncbi:helix-turn-helix domain-containing protein [Mycobacterium sp. 23]|uniref:helix-turn-helix domain-containing protein n=1 Tax=Mycobacterium sp. 23 TaxID=3400424 RepID=UPI003AB01481
MTTEQCKPRLIPIPAVQNDLGGISRTTVYELIGSGELTRINIGRRSFVTEESITAYLGRLSAAAKAVTA